MKYGISNRIFVNVIAKWAFLRTKQLSQKLRVQPLLHFFSPPPPFLLLALSFSSFPSLLWFWSLYLTPFYSSDCKLWKNPLDIQGRTNINHKGLQRTANEYAEERRIYKDLISKNNNVDILNSASRILQCWSYYVKINSARHQHDTERTQNRAGL